MNKFNCNKLFSVFLVIVLVGLSTAILHPYVHAFNNIGHSTHHTEIPAENGVSHIDSTDNCYVCTFSKNLTFDQAAIKVFKSDVVTERIHLLPSFHFTDILNFSFFLRGPPLL
jgi:hypothetical protein